MSEHNRRMKLTPLFTISILLSGAAFAEPIKLAASNIHEAFNKCYAEVGEVIERVNAERKLAEEKPYLFDIKHEDYYENFRWAFLISDEYTKVTILDGYCKEMELEREGYYESVGYIKYLEEPLRGVGESEVKEVVASYGFKWSEVN